MSIFNKVTERSKESLTKRVIDLIDSCENEEVSKKVIDGIVDVAFEKGLSKPEVQSLYAEMCAEIRRSAKREERGKMFRTAILSHCQTEFEEKATSEERRESSVDLSEFETEGIVRTAQTALSKRE